MSTTTTGNFPINNVHFPGIIDFKISANSSYLYSEKCVHCLIVTILYQLFDIFQTQNCFLISIVFDYRCFCDQGYDGKDCDRVYKPCSPTPCQNGGSCSQVGSYGFSCSCPTGKNFFLNKYIICGVNAAIHIVSNLIIQGVC